MELQKSQQIFKDAYNKKAWNAKELGFPADVEKLLNDGHEINTPLLQTGLRLLDYAVMAQDAGSVEFLLKKGAIPSLDSKTELVHQAYERMKVPEALSISNLLKTAKTVPTGKTDTPTKQDTFETVAKPKKASQLLKELSTFSSEEQEAKNHQIVVGYFKGMSNPEYAASVLKEKYPKHHDVLVRLTLNPGSLTGADNKISGEIERLKISGELNEPTPTRQQTPVKIDKKTQAKADHQDIILYFKKSNHPDPESSASKLKEQNPAGYKFMARTIQNFDSVTKADLARITQIVKADYLYEKPRTQEGIDKATEDLDKLLAKEKEREAAKEESKANKKEREKIKKAEKQAEKIKKEAEKKLQAQNAKRFRDLLPVFIKARNNKLEQQKERKHTLRTLAEEAVQAYKAGQSRLELKAKAAKTPETLPEQQVKESTQQGQAVTASSQKPRSLSVASTKSSHTLRLDQPSPEPSPLKAPFQRDPAPSTSLSVLDAPFEALTLGPRTTSPFQTQTSKASSPKATPSTPTPVKPTKTPYTKAISQELPLTSKVTAWQSNITKPILPAIPRSFERKKVQTQKPPDLTIITPEPSIQVVQPPVNTSPKPSTPKSSSSEENFLFDMDYIKERAEKEKLQEQFKAAQPKYIARKYGSPWVERARKQTKQKQEEERMELLEKFNAAQPKYIARKYGSPWLERARKRVKQKKEEERTELLEKSKAAQEKFITKKYGRPWLAETRQQIQDTPDFSTALKRKAHTDYLARTNPDEYQALLTGVEKEEVEARLSSIPKTFGIVHRAIKRRQKAKAKQTKSTSH